MKRVPLNKRAKAALPPGPIHRDIHPDCTPVALYRDDGSAAFITDLPLSLVAKMRAAARRRKVCTHTLFNNAIRRGIDKMERGL